jgi:hypothetical protein
MHEILATQEPEIRRIAVRGQPEQKVYSPVPQEGVSRRIAGQASPAINSTPYSKNT